MAKLRRPHTAEPVGGYEGEAEFLRTLLSGQPDFAEQHPSRRGEGPLLGMTLVWVVAAQKTQCRLNKPPRQCAMILVIVVRQQTCPIR
jgi:hypothetical protein